MSSFSSSRSTIFVVLLSLLSLSLLPVSLARDYCDSSCGSNDYYCDCGNCECDGNGDYRCSGSCGFGGGTVAGIVIAVIIVVGIALCLLSLCYRRRYYNYGGTTYGTGARTVTTGGVPMQAVPVNGYAGGGYGSPQQPMQAIPVQYAQYPAQPQYNPYGTTYAAAPVGGGQPIDSSMQPPAYTAHPSAPEGEGGTRAEPIEYPTKSGAYDGERAI